MHQGRGTEHVADPAAAVVDPVHDRFNKRHEPPHQVEREVGSRLSEPFGDGCPGQGQVPDEIGTLRPVDEGTGGS
jgi:hypothetical protein